MNDVWLCSQDAEAVERLNESGELRSILRPFKVSPKIYVSLIRFHIRNVPSGADKNILLPDAIKHTRHTHTLHIHTNTHTTKCNFPIADYYIVDGFLIWKDSLRLKISLSLSSLHFISAYLLLKPLLFHHTAAG